MLARWRRARGSNDPHAGAAPGLAHALAALVVLAAPVSFLHAQETAARDAPAPPKRLRIALLGLENRTGDAELAHWRYARVLLGGSLHEVKAVRVLPAEAVRYALRQVGLRVDDPIDPNYARLMGGHIEAQRVIWGAYAKDAEQWYVTMRVMNVATGAVSPEFRAEAKDWFDIRDRLNEQILAELGVTGSPEEKQKAQRRWIRSTEALDGYLRMHLFREQGKPVAELEEACRKVLAADPNCEPAYCDLAGALAMQGKFDLAEEMARKALQIRSDSARAHYVLGWLPMVRGQLSAADATSYLQRAETEFRQACQLDPDDADCQVDLARICAAQGRLEEAAAILERAVSLDRTGAMAHASLAIVHALRRQEDQALRELQEARRYVPEGTDATNTLSAIAAAYERLGRLSEALEYHERTLSLAKEMGANPNMIRLVETQIEALKSRLTPTFIQASPPKRYTENELDKILWDKLTEDEHALVGNPFSCTDAMTQWSKELTRKVDKDLDKTRAIFEELSARLTLGGQVRSRTSREVFEAWKDPKARLVCMDRAILFVALARAVNLDAFFVHVTRLADGKVKNHACAAVFLENRAVLVDPTQHWLGVPHQGYAVLDDLQTAAFLCFNNREEDDAGKLAVYRAGLKLWPDSPQGRVYLAGALHRTGQTPEAILRFAGIARPESQDWHAANYWALAGELEAAEEHWERVQEYLLKSISLCPDQSEAYFNLGIVCVRQHRLAEARTAFRACLRNEPSESTARTARGAIALINEEIGVEAVPETAKPDAKPQ